MVCLKGISLFVVAIIACLGHGVESGSDCQDFASCKRSNAELAEKLEALKAELSNSKAHVHFPEIYARFHDQLKNQGQVAMGHVSKAGSVVTQAYDEHVKPKVDSVKSSVSQAANDMSIPTKTKQQVMDVLSAVGSKLGPAAGEAKKHVVAVCTRAQNAAKVYAGGDFTGDAEKDFALLKNLLVQVYLKEIKPFVEVCTAHFLTFRSAVLVSTREVYQKVDKDAAIGHEMAVDVVLTSTAILLLWLLRSMIWGVLLLPFRIFRSLICCVCCCSCLRGRGKKAAARAASKAKKQGRQAKVITLNYKNIKYKMEILPKTRKADIAAHLKKKFGSCPEKIGINRLGHWILQKPNDKIGVTLFEELNRKKQETWDVRND